MDRIKILIVEDEVDLLEVLTTILDLEGMDCRGANNGKEALQKIAEWKLENWIPQVIISDITMPVMNGYELLQALSESGSPIPFYFMSGHADTRLDDKMRGFGARGIFTKPIKSEDVLNCIRSVSQ